MYYHYIGWCIRKCPLYRGVLYSECPLSEVPPYVYMYVCNNLACHGTSTVYTMKKEGEYFGTIMCLTTVHILLISSI